MQTLALSRVVTRAGLPPNLWKFRPSSFPCFPAKFPRSTSCILLKGVKSSEQLFHTFQVHFHEPSQINQHGAENPEPTAGHRQPHWSHFLFFFYVNGMWWRNFFLIFKNGVKWWGIFDHGCDPKSSWKLTYPLIRSLKVVFFQDVKLPLNYSCQYTLNVSRC